MKSKDFFNLGFRNIFLAILSLINFIIIAWSITIMISFTASQIISVSPNPIELTVILTAIILIYYWLSRFYKIIIKHQILKINYIFILAMGLTYPISFVMVVGFIPFY